MGIIDIEVARRVARLLAEREAALGIRLEIASIELPAGTGEVLVQFRPWDATRPHVVGPTGSVSRQLAAGEPLPASGSLHLSG